MALPFLVDLFLLLSAVASSGGLEHTDCLHGDYDSEHQACKCHAGWGEAGITDTIDFLHGVCNQYHCKSDEQCQEALDVPGATCPVPNWNCYCGWYWAFHAWGMGYETSTSKHRKKSGKCMGLMYNLAAWATTNTEWFMLEAWKAFLPVALVFLPFGRKRANCDHHRPSVWNGLRTCLGCQSTCRGECVMTPQYTLDVLKDDLAWSLYVLDVGFWVYLFMFTLWVLTLSIWSLLLWLAVLVILLCAMLAGVCVMCGEGMSGSCDCCWDAPCPHGECCECCYQGVAAGPADEVFWSGPYPYDPWWGYGGYGNVGTMDESNCCNGWLSYCVCRPIAWLFYVFPVIPENAWGGFCGYFVFGTHQHTPPERLYQGGNHLIEMMRMGWRRRADLHGNDSWRLQVYNFLTSEEDPGRHALDAARAAGAFPPSTNVEPGVSRLPLLQQEPERRWVACGRAYAVYVNREFDRERDQCIASSFEDYQSNACWICMSEGSEWDLWLSCRHLFCKSCSTEMLQRRMPCPLCRVSSSTVLRGLCWTGEEAAMRREQLQARQRAELQLAEQRLEALRQAEQAEAMRQAEEQAREAARVAREGLEAQRREEAHPRVEQDEVARAVERVTPRVEDGASQPEQQQQLAASQPEQADAQTADAEGGPQRQQQLEEPQVEAQQGALEPERSAEVAGVQEQEGEARHVELQQPAAEPTAGTHVQAEGETRQRGHEMPQTVEQLEIHEQAAQELADHGASRHRVASETDLRGQQEHEAEGQAEDQVSVCLTEDEVRRQQQQQQQQQQPQQLEGHNLAEGEDETQEWEQDKFDRANEDEEATAAFQDEPVNCGLLDEDGTEHEAENVQSSCPTGVVRAEKHVDFAMLLEDGSTAVEAKKASGLPRLEAACVVRTVIQRVAEKSQSPELALVLLACVYRVVANGSAREVGAPGTRTTGC